MDDGIRVSTRVERQLQPWLLRNLGERAASSNGAARVPEPRPPAECEAGEAAVERSRAVVDRARVQFAARVACPWRFENYPLTELAQAPGDAEVEAWIAELSLKYERAIEGDDAC